MCCQASLDDDDDIAQNTGIRCKGSFYAHHNDDDESSLMTMMMMIMMMMMVMMMIMMPMFLQGGSAVERWIGCSRHRGFPAKAL